jgi:integrase
MLSNAAIKAATPRTKPYRLYDERGLHLLVTPRGGRWWRIKYRFNGRAQMLSLGVYPEVSLKDARSRRDEMLRDRANGINPADQRRARRHRSANTFETVAREWFSKYAPTWVESHSSKVIRRLELYLFPWIGGYPIASLSAPDILKCLRRAEEVAKLETAKRVLQSCARIFRYAIATGRAERNPAVDLQGSLAPAIGRHLAAITNPSEFAELLRKIESYPGSATVRLALKLAPLVFVRPGELRSAEWSEIDFSNSEWHIPAPKMKMRGKHIVPLARQSMHILRELRALTGTSQYVFPSARSSTRPLSNVALLAALRRMGYEQGSLTVHGFRSTASTMLNEQGKNRDWIERQLAHGEQDGVRAAYNYADYLPQRKAMMQEWADYLDKLRRL